MTDLEILETFIVDKPAKSGMYLTMIHGRNHPEDQLHDWGFDGPMIGPLEYVHVTYCSTVNIGVIHEGQSLNLHDTMEIVRGALLLFKGKYYGDWATEYHEEKRSR
jgi:hypothetical protein